MGRFSLQQFEEAGQSKPIGEPVVATGEALPKQSGGLAYYPIVKSGKSSQVRGRRSR